MIVFNKTSSASRKHNNYAEIKLNARAVSRGVAIGKVICLHGRKRQFYRIELKDNQIKYELRRFRAAILLAKSQLKKISTDKSEIKANIFDTHLLILEDQSLISEIEKNIAEQKVNAEWAVKIATDFYISNYKAIADEHLRERYIDFEDITDRLLNALGGNEKTTVPFREDAIIVAKEVKPSTLIELFESKAKAIITERGGWTSHTFILAREMNLPAVTGLKGILRRVQTGDSVIVDGYNGKVVLQPNDETFEKYEIAAEQFQKVYSKKIETVKGNPKTLDGREITIRANVDLPKGFAKAKRLGAQGIGLYRSEFLFNQYKGFPSEQKQIEAYRKIAELVGEDGVRIRTFDLSIEQFASEDTEKEQNPALGLRGIRLNLTHNKEFRIQLRALLQASAEHRIDIVLPMISDVSEILLTGKILQEEKEKLKKSKIKFGNPQLGAMIEVPAAVLMVNEIAREVDFLSLGTNDLVQYLLAVDRDNELVADWFRTLHPAVLKSIKTVLQAAENNEIPIIICGEMAGSPFYAPILVGLGATALSMNAHSIPRVRRIISGIAYEEAREIVKKLETCGTADEVENLVRENFNEKWSHLFSTDILPAQLNQKSK